MKDFRIRFLGMGVLVFLLLVCVSPARAQLGDILKGVQKAIGVGGLGGGGLSEGKIIEGLKEALQIGTGNAVSSVSQAGGYLNNPKIKIPLPGILEKTEKVLRTVGFGSQLDAFELSMNQAAEKAAPEAKSIFWDAIKEMDFDEAKKILGGPDDAATQFFKGKTFDRLREIFKPIVHSAMGEVGVTSQYQAIEEKVSSIPFADSVSGFDLDNYVTDKGLDGLFLMLAEEERKIRTDPAARVTDLLKDVFGK